MSWRSATGTWAKPQMATFLRGEYPVPNRHKAGRAARGALLALFLSLCGGQPRQAAAIGPGDADAAINAFNAAFLVNSGGQTYYKEVMDKDKADYFWVQAVDIEGEEDAYERTGTAAQQKLVNDLLTTFLVKNHPPWTWNGWNDDMGWVALVLIRGHQMTGTANFLTQAKAAFDFAYQRGWDTQYNGGGIWERQLDKLPAGTAPMKESLSNDSLGAAACMIYQSTGDVSYLTKAQQIYDWVSHNLYNATTGQVYRGVERDGKVDMGKAVYNQGTFVDFANLLYETTGKPGYFDDAKRAVDYVKNNETTGGILSNKAGYLKTWAAEFARGLGHFVRDNHQWSTYYPWMVQNADAAWGCRRTDLNIAWNGWTQPTPVDNNAQAGQYVSAVVWLQFTPATLPNNLPGIHAIVCQHEGMAVDDGGSKNPKSGVVLKTANGSQTQKWNFRQNADATWNITSLDSFQMLDNGNSTLNWAQMIQCPFDGTAKQRWGIAQQMDGSYKIWNQASNAALNNSGTPMNGHVLTQMGWTGGSQQRWLLQ